MGKIQDSRKKYGEIKKEAHATIEQLNQLKTEMEEMEKRIKKEIEEATLLAIALK